MLEKVRIINYRNLPDIDLEIGKDINLIVGSNGKGKTNFIEAIYYLIFGESFRPIQTVNELKGPKETYAKISALWSGDTLDFLLNEANQRKFVLNAKRIHLAKIPSRFPVILFAPQSVDLVAREPGFRRQDLDNYLSTLSVKYKETLNEYKSVLKNRNALIKMVRDTKAQRSDLVFWNNKLVELGAFLFIFRLNFFDDVKDQLHRTVHSLDKLLKDDLFKSLVPKYLSSLEGANKDNYKDLLNNKLIDNQDKEIIVGTTLYGVHRDDFQLDLQEINLRFLGSRGQQRIGVLLFKFAQSALLETTFSQKPILLLDDLMSELDNTNREKISYILQCLERQTILTSADINEIPKEIQERAKSLLIF